MRAFRAARAATSSRYSKPGEHVITDPNPQQSPRQNPQQRQALTVWFVTDHKAGHRTQLLGLEQALDKRCTLDSHWLSIEHGWGEVWQQWRRRSLPAPDWLIGAGRLTHLPALLLKWRFNARAMVLSKPAWPFSWFDLLALPRHDGVRPRDHLLLTEGSLNPVLPAAAADPGAGLLLIGGPSPHFGWDGPALIQQIREVVSRNPDLQWTLSTSRRTPEDFLPQLAALELPSVTLLSVEDTEPGWVARQLQRCATVWVSEDSVSMVYESLSAGARVGLFEMPRRGHSRVASGVDSLAERHYLTRFRDFVERGETSPGSAEDQHPGPLQEAARVADWMLDRMARGTV